MAGLPGSSWGRILHPKLEAPADKPSGRSQTPTQALHRSHAQRRISTAE
jgi:hypothetical protein